MNIPLIPFLYHYSSLFFPSLRLLCLLSTSHHFSISKYQFFSMNTSSFNQSNELPFPGPSPTVMILHNTIIIVVTIMGNLLLIGAVFRSNRIKRRKRVTPVQVLMLHLTTADILFALLTIFPNLITIITHYEFHGPDSLCRFVKFLQAICRPLDSIKMGVYNRPSLYAFISWSLALLLSTPQLFLFYKDDQTKECTAFYAEPWMYTVYVCIFNTVVWLLPSALAGIFYTCVCRAVWHSLAIRNTRPRESDVLMPNRTNPPGHVRTCELDRRRIQTVKLTLTIVATNFVLWAPFCLIQVVDALSPGAINPVVATYILLFGNLNSCVNPWMWFIFNRDLMRRANPFYRLPSTKGSRTELTLTERPQSRND